MADKTADEPRPDDEAPGTTPEPAETSEPSATTAATAKGDVQAQVDKELEQGFVGTKVDPTPNEAYTLTTGPDSPRSVEDHGTRVEQITKKES